MTQNLGIFCGGLTRYYSAVDYSKYKFLQAILFFSLPLIWCAWQLIALRRSSRDSDHPDSSR